MYHQKVDASQLTLVENVIKVNRTSKTVKGGRRFSFSALVVVGDKGGHVGIGMGKANEVSEAIRKAGDQAKRFMVKVPLNGTTIAHPVNGNYGAGNVLLRPASDGTGVIASGVVRAVVEAVGIQNVLSKSIGTSNPHNVVKATMDALLKLSDPEALKLERLGEVQA